MVRVFLILLFASTVASKSKLDKIAKIGLQVLNQAKLPGTIRQCRCNEEEACGQQGVQQALACSPGCYSVFNRVSSRPQVLQNCLNQKIPVLQQFLQCIIHEAGTCTNNPSQPQVTHYDFRRALQIGVSRLQQSRGEILSSSTLKNIQGFANAMLDFGVCVESCAAQQNAAGTCFDRSGCNPSFDEKKAKRGLRNCMKRLNWKQHAGQLCDCALGAGVAELNRFCPILRLMSSP